MLRLLAGHEIPKSGMISIDGKNIALVDSSSQIAYVLQNEHVYHADFENNATVFHSYNTKSLQEIVRFTESARIESLVEKKDCTDLSGGEKNLLAIVKILLMDKEIILLDEPFSALDFQSKRLLQNKILSLSSKTVIMITHDISKESLCNFDEILIMKDGLLLVSGTPEQVLVSHAYHELQAAT